MPVTPADQPEDRPAVSDVAGRIGPGGTGESPVELEETYATSHGPGTRHQKGEEMPAEAQAPGRWVGLPESVTAGLDARYEFLNFAGRGGMGAVYRARQRGLGRLVALKVMLPHASDARFRREAELAASVHSPHVVRVHALEELPGGYLVLVMQWLESDLLAALSAEPHGVGETRALPWMRQVCEGMRDAAERGIVHRDLKPSNVLLDTEGRAYVGDFGLARRQKARLDAAETADQVLLGTPHYMAPEQAEDAHSADTRSDVYSFGATFYHVLTGTTPFTGSSALAVMSKHVTEPLVPPHVRSPRVSQRLGEVLERCLAKSPAERFPSFEDLARQLEGRADQPSPWSAGPEDGLTPHLQRFAARRGSYLDRSHSLATPDTYAFSEGRRLLVLKGDLTAQRVDALVSSDDGELSMSGGVSYALGYVGGPEYAVAARMLAPARLGRAVVTPGGRLPARLVMHAITTSSPPGRGGVQFQPSLVSRDLLLGILADCFTQAETFYVRSLALPLIGTGTAGFSEETCLDTIFRFVARTLARGLTPVREVRLVLFG